MKRKDKNIVRSSIKAILLCCEEGFRTLRGNRAGARIGSTTSAHEQEPEDRQASSQQSKAVWLVGIAVASCAIWLFIHTHWLMKEHQKPSHPVTLKLPLRSYAGDYYIKVRIQGKEGWMLLDTGSSTTLLLKTALDTLVYSPLQTSETVYFPFADKRLVATKVEVPEVAIGNWHIPRLTTLMTDQSQMVLGRIRSIDGLDVFGILGYDMLRRWRVVSLDHRVLILQQQPVALPPTACVFRLQNIGGRPAISEPTVETQPVVWVIDTGIENHLVSAGAVSRLTARVRTYRHRNQRVASLALVILRDRKGRTLSLPVAIKPINHPPFTPQVYESGLIGNGLLQRYRIVFDHFYQYVALVPIDSTPVKGTYGLLLYAERHQPKLYAHFVIPQASGLGDGFVRIVAVDGVLVKGWNESLVQLLLHPRVGSSVRLTVELPNKQRQQVVCWAYAPNEVGLQLFQARTRIGSRQFSCAIMQLKEARLWLYPFNLWEYRRQSVPYLTLVSEGEGVEIRLDKAVNLQRISDGVGRDWEVAIETYRVSK